MAISDLTPGPSLYELAKTKGLDVFRNQCGKLFASFPNPLHAEVCSLKGPQLKLWLRKLARESELTAFSVDATIELLEEDAALGADRVRTLSVRLARHHDAVYLDLADADRRVIVVTASGWRVADSLPSGIGFRRPQALQPLPVPVSGGSVDALAPLLGLDARSPEFILLAGMLVGWLRGRSGYPLLCLRGEQGSGKSTTARLLGQLVDPSRSQLRGEPHDERDLMIGANNTHVLCFDNVSRLSPWLSDALCRVATGAAFTTRQLYSDDAETLFEVSRPVVLTSVVDVVERPDLADRAIVVTLRDLSGAGHRKTERQLDEAFQQAAPGILGALLDAVAAALANEATTRIDDGPRMLDFATWVTAAESALPWPRGEFLRAYQDNRQHTAEQLLDDDGVSDAVLRILATHRNGWTGTAFELLKLLKRFDVLKQATDPRQASAALQRLAPTLRKVQGIVFERGGWVHGGNRRLSLRREDAPPVPPRPSRRPARAVSLHEFSAEADEEDGNDPADSPALRRASSGDAGDGGDDAPGGSSVAPSKGKKKGRAPGRPSPPSPASPPSPGHARGGLERTPSPAARKGSKRGKRRVQRSARRRVGVRS